MIARRSDNDWGFAIGATVVMAIVAIVPYIVGAALTPAGYLFQGNTVLAPGDPNVYYSYIEQARQGALLMRDVFTSEPHGATLWQPVWLVLGWVANMFHLSTPMVYVLGRVISVVVFTLTAWWAVRWFWRDESTRRIALLLVLGASGLGGWVALIWKMPFNDMLSLPPDLWVSEMVPLLSSWTTPHFLLVTSGWLYVLVSVERLWQSRSWRGWWVVGLVSALTLSVHPFHLLTWLVLWMTLTLWRWHRANKFPRDYVWRWGAVILSSLPAILYHLAGWLHDPLISIRAAQNINLTPAVWKVLAGLGALPFLAAWGWWQTKKSKNLHVLWIGVWAVIHFGIIFSPFSAQRRLMHALIIPFALLAAPAVTVLWRRWGTTFVRRIGVVIAGLVLLGTSSLIIGGRMVTDYVAERNGRNHWEYYLTPEYQELFHVLKSDVQSGQPILASLWDSNLIGGFSARTVVVGHAAETLRFEEKYSALQAFFSTDTQGQQEATLRRYGVCFILDGPRERSYGPAFVPAAWTTLRPAWSGRTMTLYRVTDCSSAG